MSDIFVFETEFSFRFAVRNVSYAYSICLNIRTYDNVFYFSVRVSSSLEPNYGDYCRPMLRLSKASLYRLCNNRWLRFVESPRIKNLKTACIIYSRQLIISAMCTLVKYQCATRRQRPSEPVNTDREVLWPEFLAAARRRPASVRSGECTEWWVRSWRRSGYVVSWYRKSRPDTARSDNTDSRRRDGEQGVRVGAIRYCRRSCWCRSDSSDKYTLC